jgi:hypothetical protein
MSGRWRQLGSRPIAERERVRAFWIGVAVLAVAAGLLFAVPDGGGPPPQLEPAASPSPATSIPPPPVSGAQLAARRFLADYLSFAYGHGSGSAAGFGAASPSLAARLSRLRVPPAARTRRPKLARLDLHRLGAQLVTVAARIAVGPVTYSIDLTVEWQAGRWLVTRVEAD